MTEPPTEPACVARILRRLERLDQWLDHNRAGFIAGCWATNISWPIIRLISQ